MMTDKQRNYIEALITKKETAMTPNLAYYLNTHKEMINKDEASALIEELLEAPDKEVKVTTEAVDMIVRNHKKIVSALNNKKKEDFGVELRLAGVKFTYSRQYLYFIGTGEKVEPADVDNETAEQFIAIAQKHVRGLK